VWGGATTNEKRIIVKAPRPGTWGPRRDSYPHTYGRKIHGEQDGADTYGGGRSHAYESLGRGGEKCAF